MNDSLYLLAVISTVVFLLLAVFIVSFALLFQRRQLENYREKTNLKAAYDEEILRVQVEVQDQTLQHVGQELHDNIGQLLTVTKLYLNSLEASSELEEIHHLATATNNVVDKIIADVRSLSKSLDGNFVQEFGLIDTLTHELAQVEKARRFSVQFAVEGTIVSLGFQRELVLFRIIQEILNNTLKHAAANCITIRIAYGSARVQLSVADDGQGFDYEAALKQGMTNSGLGLRNIQRRIELIGGTCVVKTAPGQGTATVIDMPIFPTVPV